MRKILSDLFDYNKLSTQEAEEILVRIASGEFSESEISAFLTVFNMRTISIEELEGFRNALLRLCIDVDFSDFNTIDLCGTGGDGKDTFNISTLSAFVVAGAGCKVAKHGNYGASSSCGSSNVMEALGYTFKNDQDQLRKELDKCGITFLHAPLFNPAMKHVAPVRRALGLKTFFNMLGPMVNPSRPQNQLVGVFSLELARMYSYLYEKESKNYCILHSLAGYDEISLTSPFKTITNQTEAIFEPADLGLPVLKPEELASTGDVEGTAKIFTNILKGEGTEAQNAAVIANSAMAIDCYNGTNSLADSVELAKVSLLGGKALNVFKNLLELK